jgi:hypothetical protein
MVLQTVRAVQVLPSTSDSLPTQRSESRDPHYELSAHRWYVEDQSKLYILCHSDTGDAMLLVQFFVMGSIQSEYPPKGSLCLLQRIEEVTLSGWRWTEIVVFRGCFAVKINLSDVCLA